MYRMTIEKIRQEEQLRKRPYHEWSESSNQMELIDVVDRSLTVTLTDEEYQAVKKGFLEVFK